MDAMTVRDAATATAATAATAATRQERVATPRPPIIDCDVHNMPDSIKDLYPYLARRWRDQVETFGVRIPSGRAYSKLTRHRQDARPPSGRGPASEVGFMGEHYLDPHNVAYAILNAATEGASASDLELGAALATAANDWTLAEWLDPEPRLRASIMVAPEDPVAAAAEVRRRAGDRRFVQVLFMGADQEPMGRRKYWPIYEACAENGLPVATHAFGGYGLPITGAGHASYYLDFHLSPAQST